MNRFNPTTRQIRSAYSRLWSLRFSVDTTNTVTVEIIIWVKIDCGIYINGKVVTILIIETESNVKYKNGNPPIKSFLN